MVGGSHLSESPQQRRPHTSLARCTDAVVMLDLRGVQRRAVDGRFLQLAREVQQTAGLALTNLDRIPRLRLIPADRSGGHGDTVDVQPGRGAVISADDVVPGVERARATGDAQHAGAAVDPELPGAAGAEVQVPALWKRAV